ncbi:hypothetical protein [Ramlibacter sp.]|uniref:hypothetical protein n=1 Tax=Ramlibacter sp. TaxID=1917967 RepID=UPI003D0BD263
MPLRPLVLALVVASSASLAFAQTQPAPASTETPADAVAAPDPDAVFKGRMGGTFGKSVQEVMPATKRVAVAAFRVAFVTDNSITAQVRGAYLPGMDMSGARSSFYVTLKGVEPKTLQAITDRAYADFLQQIAASGREVVPMEQFRDSFAGFKVTGSPQQPHTKEQNGQTATFFSPTGMPLVFTHFETGWGGFGNFDLTNYRKLQEISSQVNATVIAPMLVVNFARMSSSGNQSGLMSRTAETGGELSMSVAALNSIYIRTEEFRNGMLMKGDEGSLQMAAAIASPMQFGTMQTISEDDNRAVRTAVNVLGMFAGIANAGGAARSVKKAVATTTDDTYAAPANDALSRTSAAFGRWWKKYPATP